MSEPKLDPKWTAKKEPWMPVDWDDTVIESIRALAVGRATERQQIIAWAWLQHLSGTGELSYRPGASGERDTCFAEGRRFVGLQLLKMLHPDMTAKPDDQPRQTPKRTTR